MSQGMAGGTGWIKHTHGCRGHTPTWGKPHSVVAQRAGANLCCFSDGLAGERTWKVKPPSWPLRPPPLAEKPKGQWEEPAEQDCNLAAGGGELLVQVPKSIKKKKGMLSWCPRHKVQTGFVWDQRSGVPTPWGQPPAGVL